MRNSFDQNVANVPITKSRNPESIQGNVETLPVGSPQETGANVGTPRGGAYERPSALPYDGLRAVQRGDFPTVDRSQPSAEEFAAMVGQQQRFEMFMDAFRKQLRPEPFADFAAYNSGNLTQIINTRVTLETLSADAANATPINVYVSGGSGNPPVLNATLAAGATLTNLHIPLRELWVQLSATGTVYLAGYSMW
jgi:hypothetical protein